MLNRRGFTLIELMVTLAVFAILIMMALPSFSAWMNNMRIRGAAEAVQNGLHLARTTAIAHNTQVMFVFPTPGSLDYLVYELVSPGALPVSWTAPASTDINMVQQYNQAEGASNTAVTIGGPDPAAYMVTFGSLGQVLGNPDGSTSLTKIGVDSATSSGQPGIRPLNVLIFAGGATKACDPDSKILNTDSRFCSF